MSPIEGTWQIINLYKTGKETMEFNKNIHFV